MRSSTNPRTGRRFRGAIAAVSAIGVLALLLAPVAPGAGTTIVPPYHGSLGKAHWGTTTGCGHWIVQPKAHWNDTAGRAAWKLSTMAAYCISGASNASARLSLHAVLHIPLSLPGGTHSVVVNASASYVYQYSLHLGGLCPAPVLNRSGFGQTACRAETFVFLHTSAVLVDLTLGVGLNPSTQSAPSVSRDNSRFVSTSCAAFSCTSQQGSHGLASDRSAQSLRFDWGFNASFNGSHRFELVFDLQSGASSEVYGYPSGAARSTFNFAGYGRDGFQLGAISII